MSPARAQAGAWRVRAYNAAHRACGTCRAMARGGGAACEREHRISLQEARKGYVVCAQLGLEDRGHIARIARTPDWHRSHPVVKCEDGHLPRMQRVGAARAAELVRALGRRPTACALREIERGTCMVEPNQDSSFKSRVWLRWMDMVALEPRARDTRGTHALWCTAHPQAPQGPSRCDWPSPSTRPHVAPPNATG